MLVEAMRTGTTEKLYNIYTKGRTIKIMERLFSEGPPEDKEPGISRDNWRAMHEAAGEEVSEEELDILMAKPEDPETEAKKIAEIQLHSADSWTN